MEENRTPNLCLDGSAVRRIREEKRLTQLYVAKVVGVTTDTISRWENNRYPSVRRENVVKLAEALEVSLDQILRGESEEAPSEAPAPPRGLRRRGVLVALSILLLLLMAMGMWFLGRQDAPVAGIAAERLLPPHGAPGSVIPVRIRLRMEGEAKGFILREHFPRGWSLVEAFPAASSLDNVEGTVRWILKSGEAYSTISYLVRVAPDAQMETSGVFRGEVVGHSSDRRAPSPVAGAESLRISPYLWADLDGDAVVDDGEMLQTSEVFDEMRGVHLDWTLLETIWDAGHYLWSPDERSFQPVRSPAEETSVNRIRPSR